MNIFKYLKTKVELFNCIKKIRFLKDNQDKFDKVCFRLNNNKCRECGIETNLYIRDTEYHYSINYIYCLTCAYRGYKQYSEKKLMYESDFKRFKEDYETYLILGEL